jgi:hypothetical protein
MSDTTEHCFITLLAGPGDPHPPGAEPSTHGKLERGALR